MWDIPEHLAEEFSERSIEWGDETLIRGDALMEFVDACRRDGIAVAACEGFLEKDGKRYAQMELIADFEKWEEVQNATGDWPEVVAVYSRVAKEDLKRRLELYEDPEKLLFEFFLRTEPSDKE